MYFVSKRLEISIAHHLKTSYDKRCQHLHGHNAIVTIYCQSDTLNEDGMVIDFKKINDLIMQKFDHKYLNEEFEFNPTAENLAYWICQEIPKCYKVKFQESEGNIAVYVKEGFENCCL